MEYLKLFDNEDNYLTYRNGTNYLKPNVSYCEEKGEICYNFTPPITYDYVDLGLPSHTKWATQNVGAYKPSDYGLYFQWGDSRGYTAEQVGIGEGKKKFADDWSDYKWGVEPNFTKYTAKFSLDLEDDAAHVNMGGDWHMPTDKQIEELIVNTTTAWTTSDGVSGMTFTSTKDTSKFIFIPAAGEAFDNSVRNSGDYGYVWASTIYIENPELGSSWADRLELESNGTSLIGYFRYAGCPARGVIETNTNTNGYSYVDLGLPSGTLWATMNVGASKLSDYGLYFQWGDTIGYTADQVGKDKRFDWDNYKFSIDGKEIFSKYGAPVLQLEDDAAHVNMGGNWHIPTSDQLYELINNADYKFTTLDGVGGVVLTSKNDSSKSIFFPAAGGALNGSVIKSGEGVAIWLDSFNSNDSGLCFYADTSGNTKGDLPRYNGLPIRGVING